MCKSPMPRNIYIPFFLMFLSGAAKVLFGVDISWWLVLFPLWFVPASIFIVSGLIGVITVVMTLLLYSRLVHDKILTFGSTEE